MYLVVNVFLYKWVSQSFSIQLLGVGVAASSGQSVCCQCLNKLQVADWMTFVTLSGLVTWQNLLKPHTGRNSS